MICTKHDGVRTFKSILDSGLNLFLNTEKLEFLI